MEERLSYCRICAAACGIVVRLDGDRVVQVRGDPGHPVSRGYTCPKGRALPAFHHAPDRLDEPRVGGRAVPWETALDDLAARIRDARDTHGPDAVGAYLATGLAYDFAGWMTAERLLALLGTRQRYTPVTVDNAAVLRAAELVTGNAMCNPVWGPPRSRLLVVFGSNPVVSHGYGTTLADPIARLREFRGASGEVWVLDPRATETARLADRHLAIRPGTDHLVFAWLVRELLREGADTAELEAHVDAADLARLRSALAPFALAPVAVAAGIAADDLERLLDAVRRAGRCAAMLGTGVAMGRHGLVAEWLRWVLLIVTGSVDRVGGMRCNPGFLFPADERPPRAAPPEGSTETGPASRPDLPRWLGQYPCAGMVDEIEAGNLRVLLVIGGNPLTAFPDSERTERALRSLDALAVLDVRETSLTAIATHVLAVAGQLERADLPMQEAVMYATGTQYTPAVVVPGARRRAVWRVLGDLGVRLGIDAYGGLDPVDARDEDVLALYTPRCRGGLDAVVAAGPRGVAGPAGYGWVRERMLPDGRWRIAPAALVERLSAPEVWPDPAPLVLVPHRAIRWVNSTPCADGGDAEASVVVHPDDARAAGVEDGDTVRVASAHGALEAVVAVDDRIRSGAVTLVHGHDGTNVGRLTSARADLDPLTGMVRQSGVPVTLEPAD